MPLEPLEQTLAACRANYRREVALGGRITGQPLLDQLDQHGRQPSEAVRPTRDGGRLRSLRRTSACTVVAPPDPKPLPVIPRTVPVPLNWARTPPTEVGIYWAHPVDRTEGEAVFVYRCGDTFLVEGYELDVTRLDWRWYGPLVCPPLEGGPKTKRNRAVDLTPSCSAVLDEDFFRDIICYLKHSEMMAHAAKLVRRMNPAFTIREALAWVDQLTHRKPIGFRRLHGFDDPPNA